MMSALQPAAPDTSTDDPAADKWQASIATSNAPAEEAQDDDDALYSNDPHDSTSAENPHDAPEPSVQQPAAVDSTSVDHSGAVPQAVQSVPAMQSAFPTQPYLAQTPQLDSESTAPLSAPALAQAHQMQLPHVPHASQPPQLHQLPQGQSPQQSQLHQQQQQQHSQSQYNQRPGSRPGNDPSSTSKIFVGGLSWETDEDSLRNYFQTIGTVLDCVIMRDRHTGHPRGFGFVTFADEASAVEAATRRHDLDGRQVEAKRAVPRNEGSAGGASATVQPTGMQGPGSLGRSSSQAARFASTEPGNPGVISANTAAGGTSGSGSGSGHRGHHSTRCKVFVGGLPSSCGGDEFRQYFAQFGEVVDAQVMIDHNTGNSRGFGFVTFGNEETVTAVVGPGKSNTDHEIMGKCVEVKRAEPKGPPSERRNSYRYENFNAASGSGNNSGGGSGGNSGNSGGGTGGGLRGHVGANNAGIAGHTGSNGSATNAAAAAAAAYYSNYPASLAEQYGAYYSNPQWQQYFAAMGYNFNAYPQGFNPYQQYLQAYMSNAGAASGAGATGNAGGASAAGTGAAPGVGNVGGAQGGLGVVSGGMVMNGGSAGNPGVDGSGKF